MRLITRNDFHRAVSGLIFAATFVGPAFAAETPSIPDLSGIWGRWFNLEAPSSGPGPVVSKLRRPDECCSKGQSQNCAIEVISCKKSHSLPPRIWRLPDPITPKAWSRQSVGRASRRLPGNCETPYGRSTSVTGRVWRRQESSPMGQ